MSYVKNLIGQSQRVSILICALNFKIFFLNLFSHAGSKKPQNDVEMGNASDEAGGQKRARCWYEHEDFCSKIQMQEELSRGKQVYLTVVSYHLTQSPLIAQIFF